MLVRNSVGSIAFARGGRVEIIPIHYVYLNGWIHGRTASPSDLPSNASVAFQVDEHRGSDHWRTVVVPGRLDLVDSVEQPRGLYRRVASFVRDLVRRTPLEAAPVLLRDLSFAVRPIQISGRVSLPRDWKELAS